MTCQECGFDERIRPLFSLDIAPGVSRILALKLMRTVSTLRR
jgi:hypothetical protein